MATTTAMSSAVREAEAAAFINQIGAGASIILYDSSGNGLVTYGLPFPPAIAFNDSVLFSGVPVSATAYSSIPLGSVPTTVAVITSSGYVITSGISVQQVRGAAYAAVNSSSINPGDSVGLLGLHISFSQGG